MSSIRVQHVCTSWPNGGTFAITAPSNRLINTRHFVWEIVGEFLGFQVKCKVCLLSVVTWLAFLEFIIVVSHGLTAVLTRLNNLVAAYYQTGSVHSVSINSRQSATANRPAWTSRGAGASAAPVQRIFSADAVPAARCSLLQLVCRVRGV